MGSPAVVKPPVGYKPDPQPPVGYILDEFKASKVPDSSDVPAFIQQGIDMSKVRQVPAPAPQTVSDKNAIAYVNTKNPYEVNIVQPDLYGKPVFNHELTHTFQATRNPDLGEISAPLPPVEDVTPKTYDYGGVEGLKKAVASGKAVHDFNAEQQAKMVQDYKAVQDKYLAKASAGEITDKDKKEFSDAHQAYHPLVKQLAELPDKNVKVSPTLLDTVLGRTIPGINTKPEPPGLPAYDTPGLGVLPADPLLGGKSVSVPAKKK